MFEESTMELIQSITIILVYITNLMIQRKIFRILQGIREIERLIRQGLIGQGLTRRRYPTDLSADLNGQTSLIQSTKTLDGEGETR